MKIDPVTIKPYDIRGIVPEQLDADAAEQVGRAFAARLKPRAAVVGRDARLTSPEFAQRVTHGLTRSGVDVVDVGQVSTDAFYFACASKQLPGIMVTASHNPKDYNGFKMIRQVPHPLLSKDIESWIIGKTYDDATKPGSVRQENVIEAFLDYLLTLVPSANLKPLKVVVDTSNGTQGPIWQQLIPRLPVTVVPLYFEPDGSFPNHGNDIVQAENQQALRRAVVEHKADLGLILDPDGDRCLAIDDTGRPVPGDFLTALLAEQMLKRYPGGTVVYDIKSSDAVPEAVQASGGTAVAWKSGHAFIKMKMAEVDAVFAGELSGHYYFKDFWSMDCGLLTSLVVLEYASGLKQSLAEVNRELANKYFLSGEINTTVDDVAQVLHRLKEKYGDADINELDGLAVRYPDWRFVARPSANEPLLRMTLEARSNALMEQKRDEVLALIRGGQNA